MMQGITAPTRTRSRLLISALAAVMGISASTAGQIDRPDASGRVVRSFDFDERAFNLDPVPAHWIRAHHVEGVRERPGFPNWNHSAFSDKYAHSGAESFMLPTTGGSVSAQLVSGVLAAIPGSDYQITGFARTEGLDASRGRLVARLLNSEGETIEGSESDSGLIFSEQGWMPIEARLSGDFPDAAWIQIDLELLQASRFPRELLAKIMPFVEPHLVNEEDLSGAVWFDDITIRHIPRLDVESSTPTNIFVAPEEPVFRFTLRDLTGDSLVGELTLTDETGAIVQLDTIETPAGGGDIEWSPEPNGYGWRHVELNIVADGVVLQRGTVSYCWTPPLPEIAAEAGGLGLIAETTPPDRSPLLVEIARRTDAEAMTLTVWDEWMHTDSAKEIAIDIEPAIDRLLDADRAVSFTLRDAPAKGDASTLVGRRLIDLLGQNDLWTIALDPLIARFGQRVHAWRLGAIGDQDIVWTEGVAAELAESLDRLSRYAPTPRWILPVDADQIIDPALQAANGFSVRIPMASPNEAIAALVQGWTDSEAHQEGDVEFVLDTHPHDIYGRRSSSIALAQRTILAWSAGARRLSIVQPWTHRGDAPGQIDPWPELAVWRTMGDRLEGRAFAGELPIAGGVRAMILVDPSGTRCAIAAWNEFAMPDEAVISLHLGDEPVSTVDIYGNTTQLEMVGGIHTVQLTESPLIIEGVDPGLIQLHAGFHVEPSMIRSSAKIHMVDFVIRNPFPTSIAGRFRVEEPSDWKIKPRVHHFSIGPGAEHRFPAEVSFGVGEIAGIKPVTLDVELAAAKRYPRITMRSTVEVGLRELAMTPTVLVDTEKDRVLVTLQITNLSDKARSIEAYVMAPGRSRKSATVSKLGPNQSTIRRFEFRKNAYAMRGQMIRFGLIEVNGLGKLNGVVEVN